MLLLLKRIIAVTLILLITSCGGGGKNSQGADEQGGTVGGVGGTTGLPGKALLGPVIGAAVEVFDITDRDTPLCQATTTTSENLEQAGIINFPECYVQANKLYLVTVSGGFDIDANDDGVLDEEPTPVEGNFHAFITGEQMLEDTWQVTAVSEALFQSVQNLLDLGTSEEEIRQFLEDMVPQLLTEDLNGDGKIDTDDVLQFNPQIHFQSVTQYSEQHLQDVINDIHLAENK